MATTSIVKRAFLFQVCGESQINQYNIPINEENIEFTTNITINDNIETSDNINNINDDLEPIKEIEEIEEIEEDYIENMNKNDITDDITLKKAVLMWDNEDYDDSDDNIDIGLNTMVNISGIIIVHNNEYEDDINVNNLKTFLLETYINGHKLFPLFQEVEVSEIGVENVEYYKKCANHSMLLNNPCSITEYLEVKLNNMNVYEKL